MNEIGLLGVIAILVVLALGLVPLWCAWQVVERAGFAPAWSLLLLLPVVSLVALWIFAFADWPALRKDPPDPYAPILR
jgi:hypothetical protein